MLFSQSSELVEILITLSGHFTRADLFEIYISYRIIHKEYTLKFLWTSVHCVVKASVFCLYKWRCSNSISPIRKDFPWSRVQNIRWFTCSITTCNSKSFKLCSNNTRIPGLAGRDSNLHIFFQCLRCKVLVWWSRELYTIVYNTEEPFHTNTCRKSIKLKNSKSMLMKDKMKAL